jgi:hypothetical protein
MATKTTYFDPTGKPQTGYIINDKTYKDELGTQRVDVGSIVNGNDAQWILTENGGMKLTDYLAMKNQTAAQGPAYRQPQLSGIGLGDAYGLKYDLDAIKGILNAATQAQYAAERQGFAQTENKFYDNVMNAQAATLDSLRRNDAAAIATGASRGMSAANELSSLLGLQQEVMPVATDLANQRNNLVAEEQAAIAKNAENALNLSNEIKQAIANLDLTKYGYDVQQSIGVLDYLASLAGVDASKYTADQTLAGVKYNADQNLAGTKYTSDSYQKNSGGGGGYTGGGGGYTPTGGGTPKDTTPSNSTNPKASTYTPNASDAAFAEYTPQDTTLPGANNPIQLSNSNDTLFYDPEEKTWVVNTYDKATGQPQQFSISPIQKRAVLVEGTYDVLNGNYVASVLGPNYKKAYTLNGKKYTYDSAAMLWKDAKGTWYSTKRIAQIIDDNYATTPKDVIEHLLTGKPLFGKK